MVIKKIKIFFLLLALLVVASPAFTSAVAAQVSVDAQQILDQNSFEIWQKINQARKNPRAVVERLKLPEDQVVAAFGQNAWILDAGLPPLAWDEQLQTASYGHGRDMLNRLYYSHVTPEGVAPAERILATGYQAYTESESLGILAFYNYVEIEQAVTILLDNLLRDELLGTPGVERNVFSAEVTELGMALYAETLVALEGQPYTFLLVASFARPLIPRSFILAAASPGNVVYWLDYQGFKWRGMKNYGGWWQVKYPHSGTYLVAYDEFRHLLRWGAMAPSTRADNNLTIQAP